MTRNNILKRTTTKFILALLTICLICTSLVCVLGCSDSDSDSSNSTNYSYSEKNETLISNSSFAYGTADLKITAYPNSSVTGWTKKAETNMTSSSSKYGVIDVSSDGWDNLVSTLYGDSYFLNYFKVKYDFTDSDVKSAIQSEKGSSYTPTSDDIKEYVIENYFKSTETFKYPDNTTSANQFANPGTHSGATDDKIYMLNNYLSKTDVGRGTAQRITSASTITLNKGEYGKVSVWVKTQNVTGLGENYGANIRLTNSFNSTSQSDFGIFNITDTEWTQYTIYIKADESYTTSFTLVLGLGADNLSATEGTVYFDDVEFVHLTASEYASQTSGKSIPTYEINYGVKDEPIEINAQSVKSGSAVTPVLYDMSINTYLTNKANTYKNAIEISSSNLTADYTVSNKIDGNGTISGGRFGSASFTQQSLSNNQYPFVSKAIKATLNKASYTLTFAKNSPISVAPESYAYLEFYVKNQLSEFGSTSITVDVFDKSGSIVKKRAAVATVTTVSDEWSKVGVIIKNNFETGTRQFYFEIVIGPTDVATENYAMNYATGDVLISNPTIATGSINQYVDDTNTVETDNYNLYSLFNASSSGTTALYAGSSSDYTEESEEEESYDLNVAPSDIGTIESRPATPNGYKGIVANHFYITDSDDAETAINTSATAGLINTKYLSAYDTSIYGNIASALNGAYDSDEEDIQPLMIYNKTATQYGYIGNSQSISASAYAKFEVTIRVTGQAKAFVYLVDTDGTTKDILTFNDFTVNANKLGETISDGKSYTGANMQYVFEVTSDMMQDDGWVTVTFYLATGATARNVRLEIWNGSRDASVSSSGYVFVNSIHAHTSSGFTEATNAKIALTTSGNPLYEVGNDESNFSELLIHKRELTDTEKEFNSEQTDDSSKVSYEAKYIWAKTDTMIYGVYNSIDPVEVDPYANQEEDDSESGCGCNTETDPATFWLSFSSILLAVVLVLALIALIVKNFLRRRKANASDAKSHYKVTSRTTQKPKAKPEKKSAKVEEAEETAETEELTKTEEVVETTEAETENAEQSEQTLDEYVYGDVQDFGETETNDEKSSEDNE